MNKYLAVFEKTKTGYSAYVPDLPGCVSAGKNRIEVEKLIKEAIEFHIEGMTIDGEKIPEPTDNFAFIKVKPAVKNPIKERTSTGLRKRVKA